MKANFTIAAVLTLVTLCLAGALRPHVVAGSAAPESEYLNPGEMAFSPDGRYLYVVCERSDELRILEVSSGKVTARIPVGHVPRNLTLSHDGKQIYVVNSWEDTLSVVDLATQSVVRTISTGAEPYSAVLDRSGSTLYVANRVSNDISVIDVASGVEKKRLAGGRGASYLVLSPDGSKIYGTHIYPKIREHRVPPQSEITVIDTATQSVIERKLLPDVAGVFHLAASSDGRLFATPGMRPKNLVPLAHVEHGWAFTSELTIFGEDAGAVIQIPLDEMERYYSMPFAVAILPDKSRVFVSTAGSDSVTVIDTKRMLHFAHMQHKSFANDLSASSNYVETRIPVGHNPRGLTLSPDGSRLYVANRLDDTLSVIDTRTNKVLNTIELGGAQKVIPLRRGEQIFYTAKYGFQGQFGCSNCHIDATFDGLQWDLEPDGFGIDIVDNRLLEDVRDTEPYKWNGGNPDLPTECGPRTEKYFFRSQIYSDRELADLTLFVRNMGRRPNRIRSADGTLTPQQEHGKAIFQRVTDKRGHAIPLADQCSYCHGGPKYTNQKSFDVGTGKPTDRSPVFDTPQLVNIAMTAPYLHDGSAASLEEIWTIFNPQDKHGITNDLTKDELNDLIEYLRTL
ncbi:MAG TPA: beta-propeller fold lactonase family protein [Acidisarcina sp.]|nr:beta-propeller fold lactonase family protein [Acidisarcina sp.]